MSSINLLPAIDDFFPGPPDPNLRVAMEPVRELADYVLNTESEAIPVSAPVWGDLRPASARNGYRRLFVTLGFAAQDASLARGLVGHDARLVSNIGTPGRDLGHVRVLEVEAPMALLVAEVLPGARQEAIARSDAVASPPGTEATHG